MFCDPLVLPRLPLRYDFFTPTVLPLSSSEDGFLKTYPLNARLPPLFENTSTTFTGQVVPLGLADEELFVISKKSPSPSGLCEADGKGIAVTGCFGLVLAWTCW